MKNRKMPRDLNKRLAEGLRAIASDSLLGRAFLAFRQLENPDPLENPAKELEALSRSMFVGAGGSNKQKACYRVQGPKINAELLVQLASYNDRCLPRRHNAD